MKEQGGPTAEIPILRRYHLPPTPAFPHPRPRSSAPPPWKVGHRDHQGDGGFYPDPRARSVHRTFRRGRRRSAVLHCQAVPADSLPGSASPTPTPSDSHSRTHARSHGPLQLEARGFLPKWRKCVDVLVYFPFVAWCLLPPPRCRPARPRVPRLGPHTRHPASAAGGGEAVSPGSPRAPGLDCRAQGSTRGRSRRWRVHDGARAGSALT